MRRSGSAAEVADAMGEWLSGMTDWDVFGTLTYDPERCRLVPGMRGDVRSMPGLDVVRAHTFKWLRSGPRAVGRPVVAGFVGLERHKSGWPHAHAVLKLAGGFQKGDLAGMGQSWFREHGYAKLEVPRSAGDVSAYVSKYVVKDIGQGDIVMFRLRDLVADRLRRAG